MISAIRIEFRQKKKVLYAPSLMGKIKNTIVRQLTKAGFGVSFNKKFCHINLNLE